MSELPLIDAIKSGDLATAQRLVEAGADVNQQDAQGWTPLSWAAGSGDTAAIQRLLAAGADVSKVGCDQRTPYLIALAAGRNEAIRMLRDAEQNAAGEGRSSDLPRKYCKAYHVKDLLAFPGFTREMIDPSVSHTDVPAGHPDEPATELLNDVVFVHQNFVVTRSPWEDGDVVFDRVTPEWKTFCTDVLQFHAEYGSELPEKTE